MTIGVTGHRPPRLRDVDLDALSERVLQALNAIRAAAGPDRPLRLVSSLAEGADSIAADQALALGWTLDVVLPFARERNAQDFPDPAARTALDERLARADAIYALDGAGDGEETVAASYERAGRVMLAQSDILLAIWDGDPARGRGGAAQIIAEAVALDIPVIHVDVAPDRSPELLWDQLDEHDLGQQTLATVPRGGLDQLPRLVAHLIAGENAASLPAASRGRRFTFAIPYAALLMLAGVRRMSRSDFLHARPEASRDEILANCDLARMPAAFRNRLTELLAPRYGEADAAATEAARRFRSAYVTNFSLAALAVVASLAGLVLPATVKPVLIGVELAIIGTILFVTRLGNRSGWHRCWLDCRQVAEQLRSLALSARLGEPRLRNNLHPAARAVARRLGIPAVTADHAYLASVRADLLALVDGQIAYLDRDARRMHRLEHRLHRLGGLLFGGTATICLLFLCSELALFTWPGWHERIAPLLIWGTIASAALPAIGAAIYGIRMQGDFSGTAERNEALADQLRRVRTLSADQPLSHDLLSAHVSRTAELLTEDLSSWLHTYNARPLALPG